MKKEDEGTIEFFNRIQHIDWVVNLAAVLKLLTGFMEIYNTFTSSVYYFYFSGKTIGGVLTSMYFVLNFYADWETIEKKPQWERFSDEPIEYKVTEEWLEAYNQKNNQE